MQLIDYPDGESSNGQRDQQTLSLSWAVSFLFSMCVAALPRFEPFHLSPACRKADEDQQGQTRDDISTSLSTGDTRKRSNADSPHQSSSITDTARSIENKPIRTVEKMEHVDLSKASLRDLLPRASQTNKSSDQNQRGKNDDKEKDRKDAPASTPSAGSVEQIPEDSETFSRSHKENQGDNIPKRDSPPVEPRVVHDDTGVRREDAIDLQETRQKKLSRLR